MNVRPEAASTFPLPPGEGGPKGRVRERGLKPFSLREKGWDEGEQTLRSYFVRH